MAEDDFIARPPSQWGQTSRWREVESEVHQAGRWLALSVGTLFLGFGAFAFLAIGTVVPPGKQVWIGKAIAAALAALGGLALAPAIASILRSARVRHAAGDLLPNVPTEPVVREGAVMHGRLTHELVEGDGGWQLRPSGRLRRNDKRFLLGFGIPFLVLFVGILSWVFHRQGIGWPGAILVATILTAVSGGTVLVLIGMMMRAGYRRLSRLSIPRSRGDLQLDSAEEPAFEKEDLVEALKWVLVGETGRRRLAIPRGLVAAVQLCPWMLEFGIKRNRTSTWAVQGLLVLGPSDEGAYHRLPLLLTGDLVGAARLMQKLAATLEVPYLFCADSEGWKAERARAKNRPPLKTGGLQT